MLLAHGDRLELARKNLHKLGHELTEVGMESVDVLRPDSLWKVLLSPVQIETFQRCTGINSLKLSERGQWILRRIPIPVLGDTGYMTRLCYSRTVSSSHEI